ETKFYDFEEANSAYGIPSENIQEIGRKVLSHDAKYTVPYGLSSFPYKNFDRDITLIVDANQYGDKKVSSVILHNEPTDYTISAQNESKTAMSLPIDNPRYVAFQSPPEEPVPYPEPKPKNEYVDADAIKSGLELVPPYYYPGKTNKIEYVNLFKEDIDNLAQLKAVMTAKADELATVPGSYRIFGSEASKEDYTLPEISAEILNNYLLQGLSEAANSEKKIKDALEWKDMSVDDKHEYVLAYSLNADKNHYSYTDDPTVFPAVDGRISYGYESAYLVLDGESDYFDMHFNKDLPEEKDENFNPLELSLNSPEEVETEDEGGGEDDDDFVWLGKFLEELEDFIAGFTYDMEFENACVFSEGKSESGAVVSPPLEFKELKLSLNKEVYLSNGGDDVILTVQALDSSDKPVDVNDEVVTLNINQNNDKPIVGVMDSDQKILTSGIAIFNLRTTENPGNVTLSISGKSGVSSNSVEVKSSAKEIKLYPYIYSEIGGFEELQAAIKAEEEKAKGESLEDV
ncbi:MAG: hypothetical protein AAB540_02930, partial [Patescibacteria group bacterium]